MKRILVLLALSACATGQSNRYVDSGNVLISRSTPAIRIKVDPAFHYIGRFDFRLDDVAEGERHVFVDADGRNIRRLFIAQFEHFLPESEEMYRYSFDRAERMGEHLFRHGTFAFSGAEAEPGREAALTTAFLRKKGYLFSDEWMVSRFLTLGNPDRKSELILFYQEDVSSSGYRLADFSIGDEETELWKSISPQLTERSRRAFNIE